MDAIGWRTTTQRHTEQYNANGVFEPGVIVGFVTDNGTPGSMFFPEATYGPATVTARINEFVERENAVANLGNNRG
jgi:hypothetical protein